MNVIFSNLKISDNDFQQSTSAIDIINMGVTQAFFFEGEQTLK